MLVSEIGQNRADFLEVNLKHRTLSKRKLHRSCLESAMTLAKHDLLSFRMLQINEFSLFTPISNFKAENVLPESEADLQVSDMKLGYDFGPARPWRSVPIGSHLDNFPSVVQDESWPRACPGARFQPHQAQSASPMTRLLSGSLSHGNSSVNIVTHWRHEHGILVMSVPQNIRCGPKAS